MPIVIREIVTEVVVRGSEETAAPSAAALSQPSDDAGARADAIVRQAVERVLEILRREWER